ncbi:MAG: hypothetical protein IKH57_12215 [Clostridia bacterium]|nr:hypothetical protein [Clostridia bacterium]
MSKSEEILRLERDIDEQPELQEKLNAEIRRIAEAGEAQSDGEAMFKAVASLGYAITIEELERATADLEKLDDDELDAAGGQTISKGKSASNKYKKREENCGHFHNANKAQDENGHDGWCTFAWHCLATILHSDATSKDVVCWSNYACHFVNKRD